MEPASTNPAQELIVVPARWGSTRFPGKPLHPIAGKPLVQHVWERCRLVAGSPRVVVATDDERIAQAATAFGADVAITRTDHPSGTDRVAEVVEMHPSALQIVNVQGDEPLADPQLIRQLFDLLGSSAAPEMVTAASVLADPAEIADPNVVKLVLDDSRAALYFSRSPIPFVRDDRAEVTRYRHLGIYGYQRSFLRDFVSWPPAPLEQAECLEQLRALHHGARIEVAVTTHVSPGVDTPEQAAAIESLLHSSNASTS